MQDRWLSGAERQLWLLEQNASFNVLCRADVHTTDAQQLSSERLSNALSSLQQRYGLLRVRVQPVGRWRAKFVSAGVGIIPWREVPISELPALIARELNDPVDASRGPLCRLAIARTDPRRATLLLVFSHVAADGISALRVLSDLLDLLRGGPLAPREDCLEPAIAWLPRSASGLRWLWHLLPMGWRWLKRRIILGRPRALPPLDPSRGKPVTRWCTFTVQTGSFNTLRRIMQKNRCTLYGLISAALLLALRREWDPSRKQIPLSIYGPTNVRRRLRRPGTTAAVPADHLGQWVGYVASCHRVAKETNIWTLAREIASVQTPMRRRGEDLIILRLNHVMMSICAPLLHNGSEGIERMGRWASQGAAWQTATVSHLGNILEVAGASTDAELEQATQGMGLRVEGMQALGGVSCASRMSAVTGLFGETLSVSLCFPDSPAADARAQRLAARMQASLHACISVPAPTGRLNKKPLAGDVPADGTFACLRRIMI